MNNVSAMLYQTIVRYAEGGERVTKVVLPVALFDEYVQDGQSLRMMRTLGVEVVEGRVESPKFYTGVSK